MTEVFSEAPSENEIVFDAISTDEITVTIFIGNMASGKSTLINEEIKKYSNLDVGIIRMDQKYMGLRADKALHVIYENIIKLKKKQVFIDGWFFGGGEYLIDKFKILFRFTRVILPVCPLYILKNRYFVRQLINGNLIFKRYMDEILLMNNNKIIKEQIIDKIDSSLVYDTFSNKIVPRDSYLNIASFEATLDELKLLIGENSYQGLLVAAHRFKGSRDHEVTAKKLIHSYDFTGKTVLDCGCNYGGVALEIIKNTTVKYVYGVDLYTKEVNVAAMASRIDHLDDRCSFAATNILNIDFMKIKVTTIMFLNVLHHMHPYSDAILEKAFKSKKDILLELDMARNLQKGVEYSAEIVRADGSSGKLWRPTSAYIIELANSHNYSTQLVLSARPGRQIFILKFTGYGGVVNLPRIIDYIINSYLKVKRFIFNASRYYMRVFRNKIIYIFSKKLSK